MCSFNFRKILGPLLYFIIHNMYVSVYSDLLLFESIVRQAAGMQIKLNYSTVSVVNVQQWANFVETCSRLCTVMHTYTMYVSIDGGQGWGRGRDMSSGCLCRDWLKEKKTGQK